MFTAAGQVIEELSGQTWEQFVQRRIFDPLGMSRSTLTIEDNLEGPEPGVPYSERRDSAVLYRQPYYTAEVAIAPAGAINSSVQDLSRWVIALLNGGRVDGKQVIPEAVLRETMAPSLAMPNSALEARGWGENLNQYYGMGRWVSSYRGHLLALHGGDLPGFHSQISTMPNDSIGVIVLVIGDHVASFYNGLTYHIYERLLDMPLTPWSERLNDIRLKNKAAGTKARTVADVGRVPGTKPSHPLDDYAGEFAHPAYGVVTVARGDTGLSFDFHGIKMPLGHFHYDRFDTPDDEEDGKFSLNFRTNPMGEVEGVEISVDQAAVTFTRQVPAALKADSTLQRYAGTYMSPSGGRVVVTFQPGKGLAIRGGSDLQPWRPHQFRVKEFPDVVISFTVEGGKVLAMRQRDPSGEFVFPRAP